MNTVTSIRTSSFERAMHPLVQARSNPQHQVGAKDPSQGSPQGINPSNICKKDDAPILSVKQKNLATTLPVLVSPLNLKDMTKKLDNAKTAIVKLFLGYSFNDKLMEATSVTIASWVCDAIPQGKNAIEIALRNHWGLRASVGQYEVLYTLLKNSSNFGNEQAKANLICLRLEIKASIETRRGIPIGKNPGFAPKAKRNNSRKPPTFFQRIFGK